MKAFISSLLFIILFFSSYADSISASTGDLAEETRLLESEFELAKKPQIYFIFDLKNRHALLKARGIVLKDMKIEDMKLWGRPVDLKPHPLSKKSALFEPKRIKIDPEKNKEQENAPETNTPAPVFEVEALELKDMPRNYRLTFDEGIIISVRSKTQGFLPNLYSTAYIVNWHLSRPILTLWNSIKGRPFTSIYLEMNEEDARNIYWSITDNSQSIIYGP